MVKRRGRDTRKRIGNEEIDWERKRGEGDERIGMIREGNKIDGRMGRGILEEERMRIDGKEEKNEMGIEEESKKR